MQPEANAVIPAQSLDPDWASVLPFVSPVVSARRDDRGDKIRRVVDCLARRLAPHGMGQKASPCRLDTFDADQVAELRDIEAGAVRLEIGDTFWGVAVRHLEPTGLLDLGNPVSLRGWSALLQAMAELAGRHQTGRRLGRAMAEAQVSDAQAERLLRARGPALATGVAAVVAALRAADQRVDCLDIACLVLSEGCSADKWRQVRRNIASSFHQDVEGRREARSRHPRAESEIRHG